MKWVKKLPRLQKIMLRNYLMTLAAYHIAIIASVLTVIFDINYYSLTEYLYMIVVIYVFNAWVLYVNLANPNMTRSFAHKMLMIQIIVWFVLFGIWNFLMVGHQGITLISAMMVMAFLYAFSTLFYSMLITFLVALVHLMTTYMGIQYFQHTGSMAREWIFIFTFVSSAILLSIMVHRLSSLLRAQASRDHLTKLLNRRAMSKNVQREFNRCARFQQTATLVMIDLDDFKMINDHYGHQAGDAVLVQVAQTLKNELRVVDYIARWGGEEFLALLVGIAPDKAEKPMNRILQQICNNPVTSASVQIPVTFSCGMAQLTKFSDVETAIKEADRLLYLAKSEGKNRIVWGRDPIC